MPAAPFSPLSDHFLLHAGERSLALKVAIESGKLSKVTDLLADPDFPSMAITPGLLRKTQHMGRSDLFEVILPHANMGVLQAPGEAFGQAVRTGSLEWSRLSLPCVMSVHTTVPH